MSEQPAPAAMAGVDRHIGAHARAQRRIARLQVERDLDRDALRDFHPVAAGVLGRQHREMRDPVAALIAATSPCQVRPG